MSTTISWPRCGGADFQQPFSFREFYLVSGLTTSQPRMPCLCSPWLLDWMGLCKLLVRTPGNVLGFLLTGLYIIFIPCGAFSDCQPCQSSSRCQGEHGRLGPGFRQKVMG